MRPYLKSDILVPLAAIIAALTWGFSNAYAAAPNAAPDNGQAVSPLFSALDANGDGNVGSDEAAGKLAAKDFVKADTNHDGKLSPAEFTAAGFDNGS